MTFIILVWFFFCIHFLVSSFNHNKISSLTRDKWIHEAADHSYEIIEYLYPGQKDSSSLSLKTRQHMVDEHPVYNFIHTYYRFPVSKLIPYSPGIGGNF